MTFRVYPIRFEFIAREAIQFPPGMAANTLRGAFGHIFGRVAGESDYQRFFSPSDAQSTGPSGIRDRPRPFVFRASHLDNLFIDAGQRFHFTLNVFQWKEPPFDSLIRTFSQLALQGLGPGRSRVELVNEPALSLLELSLAPAPQPVSRVQLRFVTPTEIKGGSGLIAQPDFPTLAARIRDRISTLNALYGEGPLAIDFRLFAEQASFISMTGCALQQVSASRRSSRTGQIHPLGGFVGEVEYDGDLTGFLPYLNAAQWTGVGRQTPWGKGQILVTVP